MTTGVDALVRAAAEAMSTGLVIADHDGRYLFVNEALARINGAPVEAHEGRTCLEMLGDLGPEVLRLFRHAIDSDEPLVDVEMSGRLSDGPGPIRWWRTSYFPAESGGRRVAVATVVEVTTEESARREVAMRARRQSSLARLAAAALDEEHPGRAFDLAVRALRDDLAVEVAGMFELLPGGEEGLLRAGEGWPDGTVGELTVPCRADSLFGYVLEHSGPVSSPELADEDRFSPPRVLLGLGIRSGLAMAVRVDGRPWGLIGALARRPGAFEDPGDSDHLASVTALISAAVGREARRRELERVAAERRRLTTAALQAAEDERRRIAELLHDDLLQNLLYARQECHASGATAGHEGLARAAGALEDATRQLRSLIGEVHPVALSHNGLRPAIETLAGDLARRGNLEVELELGVEAAGARDPLAVGLVRELLTNVVKHARAGQVSVRITRVDDDLAIQVRDDGIGLSEKSVREALGAGHVGLASIRERVEALGGTVDLSEGLHGRGAGVLVHVPL